MVRPLLPTTSSIYHLYLKPDGIDDVKEKNERKSRGGEVKKRKDGRCVRLVELCWSGGAVKPFLSNQCASSCTHPSGMKNTSNRVWETDWAPNGQEKNTRWCRLGTDATILPSLTMRPPILYLGLPWAHYHSKRRIRFAFWPARDRWQTKASILRKMQVGERVCPGLLSLDLKPILAAKKRRLRLHFRHHIHIAPVKRK